MQTEGQGSKIEYIFATYCCNRSEVLHFNIFVTTEGYFQYFNVFIQTRLKFLNISLLIFMDKHNKK
jgi:hypothetical protein